MNADILIVLFVMFVSGVIGWYVADAMLKEKFEDLVNDKNTSISRKELMYIDRITLLEHTIDTKNRTISELNDKLSKKKPSGG